MTLGEDIQQVLHATARSLAHQHGLVCDDGTSIICWECRKRLALMPSLHCPHASPTHGADSTSRIHSACNRSRNNLTVLTVSVQ
jgi:hypothetical protein